MTIRHVLLSTHSLLRLALSRLLHHPRHFYAITLRTAVVDNLLLPACSSGKHLPSKSPRIALDIGARARRRSSFDPLASRSL